MTKSLRNFFVFVLTIALLVTVLKVLNWLPTAVEEGLMRKYSSIEDVRSKLKLREILVPSYFPQSFSWPPSVILAQTKPFPAIIMEFKHIESGDTSIIISQAASQDFIADNKLRMTQVREKLPFPLKGRKASLIVGTCKNEEKCAQISWDEGKYKMTIIMKSTPFDLIKIAESMLR